MNKQDLIKDQLEQIFKFIGIKPTLDVTTDDEGTIKVDISGDNLSFLIGYRGESLDGLQTYLGLCLYRELNEWAPVVVDINGYRMQKQEKLEQIAKNYIDKVRFLNKPVEMSPMNAYERRLIHTFISTYDDITSESTGDGASRRVVLTPRQ